VRSAGTEVFERFTRERYELDAARQGENPERQQDAPRFTNPVVLPCRPKGENADSGSKCAIAPRIDGTNGEDAPGE